MEYKNDYYERLGIDRNSSQADIAKAYRSLAKTFHPDVSSHPKAVENFRRIQEAYEILSNVNRRKEYNNFLDSLNKQPIESVEDSFNIEHSFYVDNETLEINGKNRKITNSYHMIIDGVEFVDYKGELFTFERISFPFNIYEIEYEFYTTNENITIDGFDYNFPNAHHIIVSGQEYIEFNGEYLLFNSNEYASDLNYSINPESPVKNTIQQAGMFFLMVIIFAIGGYIIYEIVNKGFNPGIAKAIFLAIVLGGLYYRMLNEN